MIMITYDDFKKLDLKIAKILEAERIENSDKLIKLIIDLGEEKRQLVAGIGKHYEPGQLINKQIVIVANLEPKNLMGIESQGMLLAASDENNVVLLEPDKEIPPGSTIK